MASGTPGATVLTARTSGAATPASRASAAAERSTRTGPAAGPDPSHRHLDHTTDPGTDLVTQARVNYLPAGPRPAEATTPAQWCQEQMRYGRRHEQSTGSSLRHQDGVTAVSARPRIQDRASAPGPGPPDTGAAGTAGPSTRTGPGSDPTSRTAGSTTVPGRNRDRLGLLPGASTRTGRRQASAGTGAGPASASPLTGRAASTPTRAGRDERLQPLPGRAALGVIISLI